MPGAPDWATREALFASQDLAMLVKQVGGARKIDLDLLGDKGIARAEQTDMER